MDLNFLQGAGLFMCIGGIILVVLLALVVRAFTSAGRNNQANRNVIDQTERGHERPTYDSQRVESSGGFGSEGANIPATGTDRDRNRARVYDTSRDVTDRQAGDPLPRLDDDDEVRRRRERRADDDDVRSSGGFGG